MRRTPPSLLVLAPQIEKTAKTGPLSEIIAKKSGVLEGGKKSVSDFEDSMFFGQPGVVGEKNK